MNDRAVANIFQNAFAEVASDRAGDWDALFAAQNCEKTAGIGRRRL